MTAQETVEQQLREVIGTLSWFSVGDTTEHEVFMEYILLDETFDAEQLRGIANIMDKYRERVILVESSYIYTEQEIPHAGIEIVQYVWDLIARGNTHQA